MPPQKKRMIPGKGGIGTLLSFLFLSLPSFADEDPHATGLRLPSPEHRSWERSHMIIPQRIKLNALGVSRINAERSRDGKEPLSLPAAEVAPIGGEIEGATEEQNEIRPPPTGPAAAPAALPSAVDNSVLKYFPPIRSQGSIGSCAQWAGMYYCFTHMNALARDVDAKNGGDAYRFSPKFTYNMINGGVDQGSWQTEGWSIAAKHGAATWTDWPYDSNFRGWPLTSAVWRNALNARVQATGQVYNCDTSAGLSQLKTLLVNGYVLTYATYINSWQFKKISDDPSTNSDDAFVGKDAAYWINGTSGGHAMTVVGYNDTVWVDINGNGTVDAGEKGAFRIANSWGTGWKEAGYTWLAYDALKRVSEVAGGPSSGRGPAWWGSYAMWVTASPAYSPNATAQFTLNHARRSDLRVSLGMSEIAQSTPTTFWTPNSVLQGAGGNYAFNGGSAAVDAEFVLDYTDIASVYDTPKRWYLRVQDTAAGNAATLKALKWINGADNAEIVHNTLPATVDNTFGYFHVNATMTHGSGNTAPSISSVPPQIVNEDTATNSIAFNVGDAQTAAGSLMVSGRSSNSSLLPNAAIVFSGAGANRSVVMTPATNQNGTTVLTLTVQDTGGLIAQSTFTLTVTPVNDAPLAQSQSLGTLLNTAKSVLMSGSDVDGDSLAFSPTAPSHGSLSGLPPNVTYTPNNGFVGVDTFTFTVSDGVLNSSPASVTVRIDTAAPTVAITHPATGDTVVGLYQARATASDNVGVSRVVFYIDGIARSTNTTGVGLFVFNWDSTSDTNGGHVLSARAYDNAGNTTTSANVNVTVINAASAQFAVDPTSLSFYGVQGGSIPPVGLLSLSNSGEGSNPIWTINVSTPWLSVSPLSGVGPTLLSVGVAPEGLSAGVYGGTVTISPVLGPDANGQIVPLLVPVSFTLAPADDEIPPTVPEGLTGVPTGSSTALLSWSPSTDSGGAGLAGYRLYRDGILISQPSLTHHTDTNLLSATTYAYAVLAVDNAGNASALSNSVTVTLSGDEMPASPSEFYSFPEPAKGGASPVIRAILGDADTLEMTIYDFRGTPVHSVRLDAPNALVDGKITFEYTWTGEIPSGVYYAVIHGKTGNKIVRSRTKVTVVR